MDYPDTFLIDTTGVSDIENKELIVEIYPNPANETVTITAENIKEVIVTNLLGEIVQSSKFKV